MPIKTDQNFQALFGLALCVSTAAAPAVHSSPSSSRLSAMPARETAADPSSGSSIFSPPTGAQDEVPTYVDSRDPGARARKLLLGGKDEIPNFQTIRTIPSLTPKQRKNIKVIYDNAKLQVQPLLDQVKSFKQKYGGNPQAAAQDPQAREAFEQLRREIKTQRQQLWQQVKFELTDQQLQELDAMRHGQLTPATFNAPILAGSRADGNGQFNRQNASDGDRAVRDRGGAPDMQPPGEQMRPGDN